MSPLIAISQRVDILRDRGERRDALDQQWYPFLAKCGLTPLAMPNIGAGAADWLERMGARGLVLSGGNDLVAFGGDAPERDATETAAIDWADQKSIPVLGVCRGMQFMAHRAGAKLAPIQGHVAVKHSVRNAEDAPSAARIVNSYHNWSIPAVAGDWRATLTAPDGSVEEMRHTRLPQAGIMWHPERERPFDEADISFFKAFFQVK